MVETTKQQARATGFIRYFTGRSCGRGHVAERLVSSGACCECQALLNRERYLRHREIIIANVHTYRINNPEKTKALGRKWREANADLERARGRRRYLANPGAFIAKLMAWNAANPERARIRASAWQKANPDKNAARQQRRRAAKLQRMPIWADHQAIGMVYQAAHIAQITWPNVEIHVDHVLPLRGRLVSGLHVHHNLQILTGRTNRIKAINFER